MGSALDTQAATIEAIPPAAAPPAPPKKPGKIPVLDGLRASAIILVIMSHMGLDKIVPGGLGVTIFFFLSGYLITTLMRVERNKTGTVDLGKFYIRRALRIFPPLYITLAILLCFTLLGALANHMKPVPVILQFVHLTNYTTSFGYNQTEFDEGVPKVPLWSLAVEEHFYLFFPILYLFLARRMSGARQAIVLLCLCAVVLGVRMVTASILPDLMPIYSWTHTRIDSILFGCILAVWSNPVLDDDPQSYVPTTIHFFGAIGVMLLCLLIREKIGSHQLFGPKAEFFRQTIRYSLQGLALFVIFSYLIRCKGGVLRAVLVSRPMEIIGLLSYTVYLSNQFFLVSLHEHFPDAPHSHVRYVVTNTVGVAITFGYAWLMYLVVERPLARMRSKMH